MAANIPYDLLGLIFGVLGLAGLAPLAWTTVQYQLPQTRLKLLDATIEETTLLLEAAIRDGFVPSVVFVIDSRHSLRHLRSLAEGLRNNVLQANGLRKQCVAAMTGLSKRVNDVCDGAQKLRAHIVTESERERRKAEMSCHETNTYSEPSFVDLPLHTSPAHHDNQSNEQMSPKKIEARPELRPLTTPLPAFASHTSTFRQPVRLDSTPFDFLGSRETLTPSWSLPTWDGSSMTFGLPPTVDPLNAPVPPPYSREGSTSSGQRESQSSLGFDQNMGNRHLQQPARLDPADTSLVDREALIAELREQIVQDLMDGIASAGTHWQSALERTLHGRSRTQSVSSGDVETGLLTLSP
ncbi:hypothetical protein EUX98_g9374 [Antrodiella citrinella]|uniref:Uncharacterized protein n=1 Tax=Antrodiella citrinella TaxID=2447956 RepID=A0A4S4LVZ4_9APHY|nr:hypothetical protein EUX98_g9374 [Antrodiella citrinella]